MRNAGELLSVYYYSQRAISHLREMRAANQAGLFPKNEGWRNVVEHELKEAEACDVLAEDFNLPSGEREMLYIAALLHDVRKRKEREAFNKKGIEGAREETQNQATFLRDLGYTEQTVELTQLAGGGIYALSHFLEDPSILILEESLPLLEDRAAGIRLKEGLPFSHYILHYIDDITRESNLVSLRERIDYVKEKYKAEDRNVGGRMISDVQFEVSRQIEEKLASKLHVYPSETVPGYINQKIIERVAGGRFSQGKT